MRPEERKRVLEGLARLDVENLAAGRITRDAMHEAARRVAVFGPFAPENLGMGRRSSLHEMHLADELNDMLRAAREEIV